MEMKLHSKILIVLTVVIVVITGVRVVRWSNEQTYSLEINSDEIYRITFNIPSTNRIVTDRDEIEEIVRYLNDWVLAEARPARWPPGEGPPLAIWFWDSEGNMIGSLGVYHTGLLQRRGGLYQIRGVSSPVRQFEQEFGQEP